MSSKAFTLIELLAVIVILAIIALIAVPIVLNIIDDSKKSSNEESIKMYGKAIENAAGNYYLKHQEKKKVTVQKLKNENLVNYNGNPVECEIEKIYQSGKIYLKDCTVGGTKVDYAYGEESYKDYIHLVEDTEPKGLSLGDKYTYDVNDNDTFYFYILSIEKDKVNLIMDRNICENGTGNYTEENNYCKYAYESSNINAYGPVTAMRKLYNATKNWINVPNMNLEYNDIVDQTNSGYNEDITYGYTGITIMDGTGYITFKNGNTQNIKFIDNIPIVSRFPKYSEVINAGCSQTQGSCPAWLVGNMTYWDGANKKYSTNNNSEIYQNQIVDYWLLSSYPGASNRARKIFYAGHITSSQIFEDGGYRPVITVPISNF